MTVTNGQIAELLALAAKDAEGHRRKAFERAAAAALGWEEEAATVLLSGRALSDLPSIGSGLAARLTRWIEEERVAPEPPPERRGFLTRSDVRRILEGARGDGIHAGDLQMHTSYSDGKAGVAAMAGAALRAGRSFAAITDHSTGQVVPRGMSEEAAARQAREVAAVNRQLQEEGESFRVIQGIEMNLSPAGDPLLSPEERGRFAWVIGSFHSALRGGDDQTSRYLRALASGGFHVLGHPTCRRFGRRPPLVADWERVFSLAAARGIAVEINAHPHRQDLPVELVRVALEAGCIFSIGTDAHSPQELEHFDFGLAIATAAHVPGDRIVNFLSPEEVTRIAPA